MRTVNFLLVGLGNMGRLGPKQMGVVFSTDIYGTITAIIDEPDPVPSAAMMLRDVLDIYS